MSFEEDNFSSLKGKDFRHNLEKLAGMGLDMALVVNPLLRRYPLESILGGSALGDWDISHRYAKTDFRDEEFFKNIAQEAHKTTKRILTEFVLDGLLDEIPR